MDSNIALEELMGFLGDLGKYQKVQIFLHCLAPLLAGIHTMTFTAIAPVPLHRCLVPGESKNNSFPCWESETVRNWIPAKEKVLDSCLIYRKIGENATKLCSEWAYDTTYYKSSRVIEWSMVCDHKWMRAVAQSAFMLGVLTGAVFLGNLADRVGRKKVLCACAMLQLILSLVSAFVTHYFLAVILMFLLGSFGFAGPYNSAFVLTMELVGPSKRTFSGMAHSAAFDIGVMIVAFWAWLIPADRFYLQLVFSMHTLLLIGHWWLVDESPRWLWVNGRYDEAMAIIQKGLKMNGRELVIEENFFVSKRISSEVNNKGSQTGCSSLFKTSNLRKRTLIVSFSWFANSLAYYGLTLNTGSLPGNPFLMLLTSAFVTIPSYAIVGYLMDKFGRRSIVSTFMVTGGFACIISGFIPVDSATGRISSITGVMIGKFLVAGAFAIIYNYTAELFPTVCRNSALGVASMNARISGALTPLIILLDSVDITLPTLIFAVTEIASGLMVLLLPETLNQAIPQTLEEGERFGEGDTAFTTCWGTKRQVQLNKEQQKLQAEQGDNQHNYDNGNMIL